MLSKRLTTVLGTSIVMLSLLTSCGSAPTVETGPVFKQTAKSQPLVNLKDSGVENLSDSAGNLWSGVKVDESYAKEITQKCIEKISAASVESQKAICDQPLKVALDYLAGSYLDSPSLLSQEVDDNTATAKQVVANQGTNPRPPWDTVESTVVSFSESYVPVKVIKNSEVTKTTFDHRLQSLKIDIGDPENSPESSHRFNGVSRSSYDELDAYAGSIAQQVVADGKRVIFTLKYSAEYSAPISKTESGVLDVMVSWSDGAPSATIVTPMKSGEFLPIEN